MGHQTWASKLAQANEGVGPSLQKTCRSLHGGPWLYSANVPQPGSALGAELNHLEDLKVTKL